MAMHEWLHKYPRVQALLQQKGDLLEGVSQEETVSALAMALMQDFALYGQYRFVEGADGSLRHIPPSEWERDAFSAWERDAVVGEEP